jgi:hypothetical protein
VPGKPAIYSKGDIVKNLASTLVYIAADLLAQTVKPQAHPDKQISDSSPILKMRCNKEDYYD